MRAVAIQQVGSSRIPRAAVVYPSRQDAETALAKLISRNTVDGQPLTVRQPGRLGWTTATGEAVLWTVVDTL